MTIEELLVLGVGDLHLCDALVVLRLKFATLILRHSAAAALISAGHPKAVQTILGHASAAFTLTVYGHMFDEDLDALAVALDARRAGDPRSAEVLQRYSRSTTDKSTGRK